MDYWHQQNKSSLVADISFIAFLLIMSNRIIFLIVTVMINKNI